MQIGFSAWAPPVPMGWIHSLIQGRVHWGAVRKGMSTATGIGFLYMIRSSLLGAALKKNVPFMQRELRAGEGAPVNAGGGGTPQHNINFRPQVLSRQQRAFSENVDIDHAAVVAAPDPTETKRIENAKATKHSLKHIITQYSRSQYMTALVGGFATAPAVAVAGTFYAVSRASLHIFFRPHGIPQQFCRSVRSCCRLT